MYTRGRAITTARSKTTRRPCGSGPRRKIYAKIYVAASGLRRESANLPKQFATTTARSSLILPDASFYSYRGEAALTAGDLDGAIADYGAAIKRDPLNAILPGASESISSQGRGRSGRESISSVRKSLLSKRRKGKRRIKGSGQKGSGAILFGSPRLRRHGPRADRHQLLRHGRDRNGAQPGPG